MAGGRRDACVVPFRHFMCALLAFTSRTLLTKHRKGVPGVTKRRFFTETHPESLKETWKLRRMTSPWPENTQPLVTPPPDAKEWKGEAILENGLKCTYYIADLDAVKEKKATIVNGGPDSVIVISDFDRTISTHYYTSTSTVAEFTT